MRGFFVEVGRVGGAALSLEASVAVWIVRIEWLPVVGSGASCAVLLAFGVGRHCGEAVVSRAGDESWL